VCSFATRNAGLYSLDHNKFYILYFKVTPLLVRRIFEKQIAATTYLTKSKLDFYPQAFLKFNMILCFDLGNPSRIRDDHASANF